ncbi:MAG: BREX-2 system phosphatase PglZ, partial [Thermodesulfobacteriota bacterium]
DTPMYRSQKAIAGRALPGDAEVGKFLHVMDRRGGTVTAPTLSRELGVPAFRLRGWLASLQRLLNVEGYAILSRGEADETITLNIDLLKRQFEVE